MVEKRGEALENNSKNTTKKWYILKECSFWIRGLSGITLTKWITLVLPEEGKLEITPNQSILVCL